jgi:uncharacterized protein (DUF433 family)
MIPGKIVPETVNYHQEGPMITPKIINRGRGPELAGTRITVYDILEYARAGWSKMRIAVTLGLDTRSVEVALNYIKEHEEEVNAEYQKIMARIDAGNPPELKAKLEASREKLKALLRERQRGAVRDAGPHG